MKETIWRRGSDLQTPPMYSLLLHSLHLLTLMHIHDSDTAESHMPYTQLMSQRTVTSALGPHNVATNDILLQERDTSCYSNASSRDVGRVYQLFRPHHTSQPSF